MMLVSVSGIVPGVTTCGRSRSSQGDKRSENRKTAALWGDFRLTRGDGCHTMYTRLPASGSRSSLIRSGGSLRVETKRSKDGDGCACYTRSRRCTQSASAGVNTALPPSACCVASSAFRPPSPLRPLASSAVRHRLSGAGSRYNRGRLRPAAFLPFASFAWFAVRRRLSVALRGSTGSLPQFGSPWRSVRPIRPCSRQGLARGCSGPTASVPRLRGGRLCGEISAEFCLFASTDGHREASYYGRMIESQRHQDCRGNPQFLAGDGWTPAPFPKKSGEDAQPTKRVNHAKQTQFPRFTTEAQSSQGWCWIPGQT
jgi:hypothetical protein